ncbi:alpha-glucan family phosphorylase [Nocardioides sp. CFH 31398]|uniref:alpha-glucan family phosphorylase n=1 Tax=Nocardioides sp. CFH 31398 TaxID=2919579 RepID=UPI001F059A00|nr:alpha-glucan family phosphorylase [Nocardioides sp. CFH 31398]MCH1868388.1 alpha-glucan family phosphorylase [Nocardioides sp. CFH 31398]
MRAIRRFTVRPLLPESLGGLDVLARNLRWSWHPETQDVFAAVDPELWETSGHDPVRLLGAVSRDRLAELARDKRFTRMLELAVADLEQYLTGDRWYQRSEPAAGESPRGIGYFSPEFGITSVLPQYSGGLGILAGDHLKTASDLGVPITGVGLLYKHGYFRQSLSRDGWQQETYPVADPDGLPITLLRYADGSPATVSIGVPGGTLHARVWVAQVGRVPLLLLDSDIEANEGHLREVTDRLYGGAGEHRLLQELLLGVGGTRALGVHSEITGSPYPEVFHTNEGHAGFLGLERIRLLSVAEGSPGLSLDAARELSRAGTVFTTHTPVPAGIDRFPVELMRQYFGAGRDGSDGPVPGLPVDWVLALGAEDYPGGDPGVFNMAVMGFRLAQRANGVSLLHGEVSRGMFNGLWPGFDENDVPIGSITNGVHAPTWVAREVFELAAKAGGDADDESVFDVVDQIPATDLWSTKRVLRQRLVHDARRRLRDSWLERGAAPAELGWVDEALSPDVLTIGFARRVPSYKRLTLMLRDPERLKRLLLHPERPIQLVIAGKSHPADDGGKSLIQQMVRFADDPEVRHRIVFLPNYDIAMAQPLYPGCDVWLNNPLRPYEACGTSGMKAALNGGLNLSILDGWWDEWYDGQNGWAIPSAEGPDTGPELDNGHRDDVEATALYDLIENHVAPRFYDVGRDGVPDRWLAMVRHTLRSLGPKVLATRMVRDYVEQLYAPAALTARLLDGDFTGANELAAWKGRVGSSWSSVAVEHVEATDLPDAPEIGSTLSVRAFVALGSLAPSDVVVQLVHGGISSTDELTGAVSAPLTLAESYEGGRHRFEGTVTLDRTGPFGYTVRVLPTHPHLAGPSELGLVALPA